MTDTVLITGISGFLGGHVALQLLEAGYRVRGSVRNLDKAAKVEQTLKNHGADTKALEFVALDLNKDDGWAEAMQGVKYLAHVASPFFTSMPDDKMDMIRPAVGGTERALNAALAADVERIVLTSSFAAIGYGYPKSRTEPFTEKDWSDPNSSNITAYVESKTRAEMRAWELMEAAGRREDLTTVNPTGIFGPLLDDDPGTSGSIVLRMLKGSLPAAPDARIFGIDVRDAAAVHVKALTDPSAGGKRYLTSNLGGKTLYDMGQSLAAELPAYKSKMPRMIVPDWVVRFIGLFDKEIRDNTTELGYNKSVDNSAVLAFLGRDLISYDAALAATANSLIEQKLV